MFVDVHAHLDFPEFEKDLEEVIEKAKKIGVIAIVNCGVNIESNRKTIELAKKYDIIKPALGIYPTYVTELTEEEFEREIEFILKYKPFAISEVGLDFKESNKIKEQKDRFQKFIEIAEKLNVPIIVHSRKAENEVYEMIKSSNLKKVVMHCFMGKLKLAKKIEEEGWLFSIPPIINHSLHFQELVKRIALNSILTETDSPFLSHIKGERNTPLNVVVVVEKIAELRGLNKEEVKNIIFMNYKRVFEEK